MYNAFSLFLLVFCHPRFLHTGLGSLWVNKFYSLYPLVSVPAAGICLLTVVVCRLRCFLRRRVVRWRKRCVCRAMVASYFVWGAGAWRELDTATGAVRGWRRRARFVLVRRGRLQLARRRPVLRALRALARGEPSAAADGPRLAHVR